MAQILESPDEFPFDRPQWNVSISFPLKWINQKLHLMLIVRETAKKYGAVLAMSSEPMPDVAGKPGFETFGFAVTFEAGDENIHAFQAVIARDLATRDVSVEFDPADVIFPSQDEPRMAR